MVAAVIALLSGLVIFLRKKAGALHRFLGYVYSLSMLVLLVTALSIYRLSGSNISRSRIKQMTQPFWSQYRLRVETVGEVTIVVDSKHAIDFADGNMPVVLSTP